MICFLRLVGPFERGSRKEGGAFAVGVTDREEGDCDPSPALETSNPIERRNPSGWPPRIRRPNIRTGCHLCFEEPL